MTIPDAQEKHPLLPEITTPTATPCDVQYVVIPVMVGDKRMIIHTVYGPQGSFSTFYEPTKAAALAALLLEAAEPPNPEDFRPPRKSKLEIPGLGGLVIAEG